MGVLDKLLNAVKLNDDYDDDEYYDDELLDEDDDDLDDLDAKPKKKFFEKFGRKEELDDLDDEEPEYRAPVREKSYKTAAASRDPEPVSISKPQKSSKITPMRAPKKASGSNVEVCVIKPGSMEDTREIADTLRENSTVILNLEGIDVDLAQRIIDFTSGSCYSLGGSLQKISSYIFVVCPSNVDITGDMQSILSGAVPSVRAGY